MFASFLSFLNIDTGEVCNASRTVLVEVGGPCLRSNNVGCVIHCTGSHTNHC